MDKNSFNFDDLSDVQNEIKLGKSKQDIFGQRIIEIFKEAKKLNILELNTNQITIVYHREFVKTGKSKPKTNIQVLNKLGILYKKGLLIKVKKAVYKLKD